MAVRLGRKHLRYFRQVARIPPPDDHGYPFLETAGRGQFLFSIFFRVVLLNVVYTVSIRGRVFFLVIGLTP